MAYYCSSRTEDVMSSRLFKERLRTRYEVLGELQTVKANNEDDGRIAMKRLMHNLTSLNAHCIQEIYDYIPQEKLAGTNQDSRREIIRKSIQADTDGATELYSRILKNNALMKVEFSVFNKLYEPSPRLEKRQHPLRKVILNVCHVFFPDFTDKEIYVHVADYENTVLLDYDSITVVLMHIIENASKYALPKSQIDISFEGDERQVRILFDMVSSRVEDNEVGQIYDEGFKGKIAATLSPNSKGIGLFIVQELLKLNGGSIRLERNREPKKSRSQMGVPYENNTFIISLPT